MSIINETTFIGTGVPYDITLSVNTGSGTIFNNNQKNIDFEVKGTGLNKSLYFDASTGRLGIGTGLPDAVLHVIAPCAKDGAIIESITNCPTGVTLLLIHNPQTAPTTGSYPATINLAGRDDNYNEINYAQIQSRILNATTSTTSGQILFFVDQAGDSKSVFEASVDNTVLGANNSLDGNLYLLLGKDNVSSGNNYIVIGSNNSGVNISDSLSIGTNNDLFGPAILTISSDSIINGSGALVIGKSSDVSGVQNIAVVLNTVVSGDNNSVLGRLSSVSGYSVVGIFNNSNTSGYSGILLGDGINNSGDKNIQIGYTINNLGNNANIIGSDITVSGSNNIVQGNLTVASGNNIISIGSFNNLSEVSDVLVVGKNVALTGSSYSLIIGLDNITESGLNSSIVVGGLNDLQNTEVNDVLLFGHKNITDTLNNSIVVGNNNNLSGTVQNTLVIGSGNSALSDTFNSIIVGTLNNKTGVYLNSQAEVSGTAGDVSSINVNSISIGHHNVSYLNSSNTLLGNKNTVSGTSINAVGSFNTLRNANNFYVLGNSNYLDGQNIVAIGKKIVGYGKDIVGINNTDTNMDIYGSGSIVIGNNPVVCSGIAVGYKNSINTVSGLVFGKNNYIGLSKHLFTANIVSPSVITINALVGDYYKENDSVLLQVKNPAGTDNSLYAIITDVNENVITTQTSITIGGALTSLNLSNRYVSINDTFDDNNAPNTTISGYIIALQDFENSKTYGINSLVFGNNNNQKYSSGIIVGNNSSSTGINTVVIGNNISGVGDNSIHIGSSNSNKIVFNDNYLVFNTGTSQQSVVYRGYNGDISAFFNLTSNRLGINNTNPRSSIDVSGLITTSGLRFGLSSTLGDALISDSSGNMTLQTPVRLSGVDNGILYRVTDKIASGLSSIKYTDSTNGINFYDNHYIIETGIILNADKGTTIPPRPMIIWGSGGVFAPKLFEAVPGSNRVSMWDFASTTGYISGLNVVDNVKFPTALTGTFLYVDTSGRVLNRVNYNNTVVFAGTNSWGSGNTKFRWFNDQNVLTLGDDPNRTASSVSTVSSDTEYNIMLSSTGTINTVFNNKGLTNNFIVYNSGSAGTNDRRGFHIIPQSGRVGVNATVTDMGQNSDAKLYVNGKTHTESLRLGGSPASGLYLRTASNGEIIAAQPTFDLAFSGIYPLRTTTIGDQVQISIATATSAGVSFAASDEGKTLVYGGDGTWKFGSGLQVWQSDNNNLQGVMVGNGASLNASDPDTNSAPTLTNIIGFAGGSFNMASPSRDGSSQFNQYHLRTRTSGNSIGYMTTNWQTTSSTTRSPNNTIRFPNNRYGVWTFRAYINVLWQSISDSQVQGAGGYIIDGTVASLSGGFTMVGTTGLTSWATSSVPQRVLVDVDSNSFQSLDFRASGSAGYNMLWSSTVQLNQLTWPNGLTLGSS